MGNSILYHTDTFRMKPARFASEMIFKYGAIWLITLCVCALAGLILGIAVDLRFFLASFMVIFIIAPLVLIFIYYYFGLKKECYVNAVNHSIIIHPSHIEAKLVFNTPKDIDTENGDEENSPFADSKKSVDSETISRSETFEFSEFREVRLGLDSITLEFLPSRKGFVWIPAFAFDDPKDYHAAYKYLTERLTANGSK